MMRIISVLLSCLLSWQALAQAQETETNADSVLPQLVKQLPNTKLSKMSALVEKFSEVPSDNTRAILSSLLNGDLYYLKGNKQVVHALENTDGQYQLTDVLSNEKLAAVSKSQIKKIKTNNSLRGLIRAKIAGIDLSSPNKARRLIAVEEILTKPSDDGLDAVKSLIAKEQDSDVLELMQAALYVEQLKIGNIDEKLAAVEQLAASLQPVVKNTMVQQLADLPKENASEEEKLLATKLNKAIEKINGKRDIYEVIENIFFGLSLGSVLLLAAIGLAITFGVMGVINMAHGEMIMLGAYTTYVIQLAFPQLIEYSLLMAVPAAFLVSGIVGIIIERGVIRYLKGRPLETLLATFGISLILQQLVRTIFSPLNRQVQAPEWMTGSWQINPIFSLTYNRLYIILFALMVFFTLLMILKKSSLGLHVRAVSQNREMARALSIKSDWVDAITFGLGSGIAGVAGVVLSQLTNVGPNLGQAYIIDSFLVVVFGGVGNLWGTLVAAMSLGSINKFLEPLTGSVLANIIVLVGLVLFIQKRPKGLFPQKGRSTD